MTKAKNDNATDPVYTVAELAARWKCHRQSVMTKIQDGELKAFKIGRQYRVALKEVERHEAGMAA